MGRYAAGELSVKSRSFLRRTYASHFRIFVELEPGGNLRVHHRTDYSRITDLSGI